MFVYFSVMNIYNFWDCNMQDDWQKSEISKNEHMTLIYKAGYAVKKIITSSKCLTCFLIRESMGEFMLALLVNEPPLIYSPSVGYDTDIACRPVVLAGPG